jgi:hypothetical protein
MKKHLLVCCVLASTSCAGQYFSTDNLDKSCQVAEDCVLVLEHDVCEYSCDGKFAAVNVREEPSLGQRVQDLREGCVDFMPTVRCDYFSNPVVICDDGLCSVDESRDSRENAGSAEQ